VILLMLLACTQNTCDENTPCALGERCEMGVCREVGCATSEQCPMESHCVEGECAEGCLQDNDCYPGDRCELETGTCVTEACADTQLDCAFREFCDPDSGECRDAGDLYCRECRSHSDCGEGNICWGGYCGVDCSQGQACPAGFECRRFTDDDNQTVALQCSTFCWLYEDQLNQSEANPLPLELRLSCPVDAQVWEATW